MASLSAWADKFGERHPRVMLLAVVIMAAVAAVLLLGSGHGTMVLYQAF